MPGPPLDPDGARRLWDWQRIFRGPLGRAVRCALKAALDATRVQTPGLGRYRHFTLVVVRPEANIPSGCRSTHFYSLAKLLSAEETSLYCQWPTRLPKPRT